MRILLALAILAPLLPAGAGERHVDGSLAPPWSALRDSLHSVAQRRGCKSVFSCREAVEMWCSGYARADGDGDGIPCENVCSSRGQVDAIRREIGC